MRRALCYQLPSTGCLHAKANCAPQWQCPRLVMSAAGNLAWKWYHNHALWYLLFSHLQKRTFLKKEEIWQAKPFCSLARRRSQCLSAALSSRSDEKLWILGRNKTQQDNTEGVSFLPQEDCTWNPGFQQHRQAGHLAGRAALWVQTKACADSSCLQGRRGTQDPMPDFCTHHVWEALKCWVGNML